jgi:transposase-like protein
MSLSETPHAVAFYCPFCGEQDIRPAGPAGYRCAVCERTWKLTLVSVGPDVAEPNADPAAGTDRGKPAR